MKKLKVLCFLLLVVLGGLLWEIYHSPEFKAYISDMQKNQQILKALEFEKTLHSNFPQNTIILAKNGRIYRYISRPSSDEVLLEYGQYHEYKYPIKELAYSIYGIYKANEGGEQELLRAGLSKLYKRGITVVDMKKLDEIREPGITLIIASLRSFFN